MIDRQLFEVVARLTESRISRRCSTVCQWNEAVWPQQISQYHLCNKSNPKPQHIVCTFHCAQAQIDCGSDFCLDWSRRPPFQKGSKRVYRNNVLLLNTVQENRPRHPIRTFVLDWVFQVRRSDGVRANTPVTNTMFPK